MGEPAPGQLYEFWQLLEKLSQFGGVPQFLLACLLFLIPLLLLLGSSLVILFYLLRPQRSLEAPRWGLLEICFVLGGWFMTMFAIFGLVKLQERGASVPPAMNDLLNLGGQGVANLVASALILLLPVVSHCQPATVNEPPRALGIGTGSFVLGVLRGIAACLAFLPWGLTIALLWNAVLVLVGQSPEQQITVEKFQVYSSSGQGVLIVAMFAIGVVIAPLSEELFFRGFLFRWLEARLGTVLGIVLSGLIFGLVHYNIAAFLPITILGMLLALLLHRTGNLWACIGLHATFNGLQLLLVLVGSLRHWW